MTETELLRTICEKRLKELGWGDRRERLDDELRKINNINDEGYFLALYNEGARFAENENNQLVAVLLGLCEAYDESDTYKFVIADSPDVDLDFVPKVRDYLKQEYCPREYGRDRVCNITTYSRFGIRSALIDMARVLGLERKDILNLTTDLDAKDDDGETLTWDKAVELYDDLRAYLERHPELETAAKKLLNRNRGMGLHASGLIISGVPLRQFLPLVKPKQDGQAASAWVEGLGSSDLGAVGLVKFDFLGLESVGVVADATGADKIYALPGDHNWSDLSYLEDPKSLEMANRADLRMVFQFDGSPAIRRLVRQGGVTCFNDLMGYTALFRPGPLKFHADVKYCDRKRGREEYEVHPVLEPILGETYGLMLYQEQVMRILNVVGKIPLKDCETARKAISKKKTEIIQKYRDTFVANGQEVLGWSAERMDQFFKEIEAWSGYGFSMNHACPYTVVSARMLYLKAHRPHGFFPAFINGFSPAGADDYQKMKEYLQEAERHGVPVHRPDYNKSRAAMVFEGGGCHYPFAKIKGIGDDAAARLERLQPYAGYEDFLARFGTDAKANAALIALRAVPGDPATLWEFYEHYKKWHKLLADTEKRFQSCHEKFNGEVAKMTGRDLGLRLCRADLARLYVEFPDGDPHYKKIRVLYKRYVRILNNYDRKATGRPTLAGFVPTGQVEDAAMARLVAAPVAEADAQYLGFAWTHPVQEAMRAVSATEPLITFEDFDLAGAAVGGVDVLVRNVEERTSAKGTTFYSVEVEDATARKKWITVWERDFNQFRDELVGGAVVRISIQAPVPPFRSFAIAPTKPRWLTPPKDKDHRVTLIRAPKEKDAESK